MKVSDTVLFTENGKKYIATVLEVRDLDDHAGSSGEPLLHLGFFAEVFKPASNGQLARVSLVGTHQQYDLCQFRLDVIHESHEFDEKTKASRKLLLQPAQYPGGRWREIQVGDFSFTLPAVEDETEEESLVSTEVVPVKSLPEKAEASTEEDEKSDSEKETIQ